MTAAPAGAFSLSRVGAMVRRYWYLLRSSWPRVLDLIYWPTVQMLMWGFLQMYVAQNAGFFARAGGVFIGSVLLWDILFRGQLGFSVSFLEEMWARNLANIMMSPLRPVEFIAALMIMSIIRLAIGMASEQMREKYGEITMLDFPQFTKDTFPGVTHMDIFSGLFGDVTDDTMFEGRQFDPSRPSAKKWLDALVAKMAQTGTKVQHISNNAPTNLASSDTELRKAGVEVGKKWLDAGAILGARSVRMNSPQALGPSIRPQAIRDPETGYPKNDEIMPLLNAAIESYKEMADYGGNLGIRVTLENHWGLAADPINIRIIIDEVNHPYCEASPDFCNWEYEYMLVSGLKALAPYAHTNVHAKYWDRWGDKNDVQRSVRIMLANGFKGTFALEYENGPLNGVEGAKFLYKEVLAALSTPVPVT